VWLQPSVATIVAAASGAIVAEHLSPANARLTVIVSYIILGLGFMPSLLIMALYLQRLAIHKVGSMSATLRHRHACLTVTVSTHAVSG
jgi:tellurite resistance protein TehA-like permease